MRRQKIDDVFHRIEQSGVSIPSSTLPSWLPASFSFGIFSFSLKPPSLPLPVFFLDATLMVASSSVQVTRISQVSFVLRRGCNASLTFPILSHGDFLGLAPLRSGSEYHSFRQRCVVVLIGTGRALGRLQRWTAAWLDRSVEEARARAYVSRFEGDYG